MQPAFQQRQLAVMPQQQVLLRQQQALLQVIHALGLFPQLRSGVLETLPQVGQMGGRVRQLALDQAYQALSRPPAGAVAIRAGRGSTVPPPPRGWLRGNRPPCRRC